MTLVFLYRILKKVFFNQYFIMHSDGLIGYKKELKWSVYSSYFNKR